MNQSALYLISHVAGTQTEQQGFQHSVGAVSVFASLLYPLSPQEHISFPFNYDQLLHQDGKRITNSTIVAQKDRYQIGVTQRKIAKTFKLSSSTVHNIIKIFRESGTIAVRKGQGRKTLLDARDLLALKHHCTSNRNATVKEITEWAQEYFQKALSVNTIHRASRRCQLKLYSAKRKPFLSKLHKLRRLHWARGLSKWKTVLWSDESRFEVLYGTLGRHVIRTREDKDNPSCYQRSVQKPASLMNNICSHLDVISFREDPAFFHKIMPDHILQQSQHHGYVGEGSGFSLNPESQVKEVGRPDPPSQARLKRNVTVLALCASCEDML
ncbi:hypothetical protein NFI96_009488 [Prochilodus magdalenae]|nr:hypothetical protein NFI96_009488 [Prochilodus magdalenae]